MSLGMFLFEHLFGRLFAFAYSTELFAYSIPIQFLVYEHTVTAQQEHWALINMSLPFFFDSGIFNSLERKLFRRLTQ